MSRDGSITLIWGDGEHRFRLAIKEWRELQEKLDIGPPELLRRLSQDAWRIDDLRETIRIGLVGGGAKPAEASSLVSRYVDDFPLIDNVPLARAIVLVSLVGASDESTGNDAAAKAASEVMDASPSPPSTDQAP